jgi:hypothetical protein
MSFVYENINQVKADPFIKRIVGPVYQIQTSWARDDERDMVLMDLGGKGDQAPSPGEPPSFYNLMWRGMVAAFSARHKLRQEGTRVTITYDVQRLSVPSEVEHEIVFIQSAFIEGLECYWTGLYRRPVLIEAAFPVPECYSEDAPTFETQMLRNPIES